MDLCLLKFEGSHAAEDALYEVTDEIGDRTPWLHEVGILARPLVGRIRVVATFPDGTSNTFHEGDVAEAVSDLGAYTGYYVSALAGPLIEAGGWRVGVVQAVAVPLVALPALFAGRRLLPEAGLQHG